MAVVVGRAEAAVDLRGREDEAAPPAERDDLVHRHDGRRAATVSGHARDSSGRQLRIRSTRGARARCSHDSDLAERVRASSEAAEAIRLRRSAARRYDARWTLARRSPPTVDGDELDARSPSPKRTQRCSVVTSSARGPVRAAASARAHGTAKQLPTSGDDAPFEHEPQCLAQAAAAMQTSSMRLPARPSRVPHRRDTVTATMAAWAISLPVELHIVSDSTGETAARLVQALEAQFPDQEFEEVRHPRVETVADLELAVSAREGPAGGRRLHARRPGAARRDAAASAAARASTTATCSAIRSTPSRASPAGARR